MAILLIPALLILAWLLWVGMYSSSIRQMNAGARLFREKRYPEAEAHFRQLLTRRLSPGVEADTRRRLADTLEILGRPEEAAAERGRATAATARGTRDPMALAAQGDLLRRNHQHNEACELYERALGLAAPAGRALIMAKLTFSHHEAGRSGEALMWAQASLAGRPPKDIRRMMERMAGVASSDQGDLEGAESYYLRALALAESDENPEEVSRTLAMLANIQYKRGQFGEALLGSRRAWQMHPEPGRVALLVELECLRDWRRFDEARAVAVRFQQGPKHDQPRAERKNQAVGALASAYIEIFAGRPADAIPYLEEARKRLEVGASATVWPPAVTGREDKLELWCDAAMAAALAGAGRVQEARLLVESVERRLSHFSSDRAVLLGTYGSLGRAALACGDLAESEAYWLRYLDCQPNPVNLPSAYFHLGEMHLRRAEMGAACEAFENAVAPSIDSFYARRAQARLDELGG